MGVEFQVDITLRTILSRTVKASNKSREQICEEMSALTDIPVALDSFNNWTCPSKAKSSKGLDIHGNKRWGMPGEMLPAFCQVTNSLRPLIVLAEPLSAEVLRGEDLLSAKLGQVIAQTKALERQRKQIEKLLAEGA